MLLILLRVLQGFSAGGEWGGAALMAVEHAPRGRRGLFGAFPQIGVPLGMILGTAVLWTLNATLGKEAFAARAVVGADVVVDRQRPHRPVPARGHRAHDPAGPRLRLTRGRDPMGADLEVSDDDPSSQSWVGAKLHRAAVNAAR